MKKLTQVIPHYEFSICTLVTNLSEYQEMIESFKNAGFTETISEFLYIDNSKGNIFDGYSGLNKFLNTAEGKYIIVCHQDILLNFDNIDVLRQRIAQIDTIDPDWAILGNAGYGDFNTKLYRITDPWGENQKMGELPAKAKSLDENFLLIKNEANLALSHNLKGFHLYATDLCTIATILGWNAYVIDFHLYHKSAGSCSESFFASKKAFIKKYSHHTKPFAIRTTCTMMIITGYDVLNRLINKKFFYSIKKRWDSFTQ
jgi:hypothetical protein